MGIFDGYVGSLLEGTLTKIWKQDLLKRWLVEIYRSTRQQEPIQESKQ